MLGWFLFLFWFCCAEGFFCFDFSAAEFASQLKIPVLGDLFCFGKAVFLPGWLIDL
jgi:hypothetical protein